MSWCGGWGRGEGRVTQVRRPSSLLSQSPGTAVRGRRGQTTGHWGLTAHVPLRGCCSHREAPDHHGARVGSKRWTECPGHRTGAKGGPVHCLCPPGLGSTHSSLGKCLQGQGPGNGVSALVTLSSQGPSLRFRGNSTIPRLLFTPRWTSGVLGLHA